MTADALPPVPRFVLITPFGSAPNSRYGYKTRGWFDGEAS
jgi:hypothetical protein